MRSGTEEFVLIINTFPLVQLGLGGHSGTSMDIPTSIFLFGCRGREREREGGKKEGGRRVECSEG